MLLGLTLEELIICSDRVAWISDDYFESLLLRQSIYFTCKYYSRLQFSLGYLLTYIIVWSGVYPRQGSQDYL